MVRPDISVIMPCWNAEAYLPDSLSCLKKQGNVSLELILIDDGSEDGTGAVLDAFAAENPGTVVMHIRNDGVSVARNKGIDRASGRYIAFLDSDDILTDGALEKLFRTAESEGADIVSARHRILKGFTGETEPVNAGPAVAEPLEVVREIIHFHRIYNNIWNKLYRRELFDGVRMDAGVSIGEDAVMNLRLFARAGKISFVDEETLLYRVHEGSAMASVKGYAEAHKPMLKAMGRALRENGLRERFYRDYLQSCVWVCEKEAGIADCMKRFNSEIRPMVQEGVLCGGLSSADVRLYDRVNRGMFPAFYLAMRIREKLTGRRWGIRR